MDSQTQAPRPGKSNLIFVLIYLLFMVKGLAMIEVLPLWEGFDEWLHYSYVAYFSRTGKIPALQDPSVPREVADSLKLTPTGSSSSGTMTFKNFWELTAEERDITVSALNSLVNEPGSPFVQTSWQAQHPPLYYVLLSPAYKFLTGKSLSKSLWVFRFLSLCIVSLGLIPARLIFRRFFDEETALAGLLMFAVYPSTFILFGHMTNDTLAFPLFMLLIAWALRAEKNETAFGFWILGGILFGLGLLTKLYILTSLPAILFIAALKFFRDRTPRAKILTSLAVFMGISLLISGPWFILNCHRYGTWNPTVHAVLSKDMGIVQSARQALLVDWKSFAVSNVIGLLWAGNWSFVAFPPWIYKTFGFFLIGITLALLSALRRLRAGSDLGAVSTLIFLCGSFLLALLQHQVQIRSAGNMDPTGAWYWAVLLPVLICLFMLALSMHIKRHFLLLLAAALGLEVLSVWGVAGFLLPYYAGILDTSFLAGHFLHSFPLSESLQRLTFLNFCPISFPVLWTAETLLWIAILGGLLSIRRRSIDL